jgi:molecular chaperone GrpE
MAQLHRASEAHERLVSENGDLKALAARARADLENARKRAAREKEDVARFAIQEFVESLLPALDGFDHALASMETDTDAQALIDGIQAIRQQFDKALQNHGVVKVEARLQPFDPRLHEAMSVEKSEKHPSNTVIDVVRDGYLLNGRLVRAARVRVSQKP